MKAADIIRRQIVNVFHVISALPSIPFAVVRWLAVAVSRLARTGEIFMIRNLYYPVTVVRRRLYGEPLWKPIDASIGVMPPEDYEPPICPDCGQPHDLAPHNIVSSLGNVHPVSVAEMPNCSLCEDKLSFDTPPALVCQLCIDDINADPTEEVSP